MNDKTRIYKVKLEKGQKWEDLNPIELEASSGTFHLHNLMILRKVFPECLEIRWNYPGSTQGNYVRGNLKTIYAQV